MIVYKITNKINGKSYIGQTKFSVEKRFKEHQHCKTSLIGKAIHKYGVENFSIEVLAKCKTQKELDEMEIFFIAYFDCITPNGYNLAKGGRYKLVEIEDNTEKRYIMVTDEQTGQIKGYFPLKSKNLGTGWIALYQNSSIWLAQQRLTGEQASVLFFLFGELDFSNYLRIGLKEISDITGIHLVNVSKAMKKLKELEIIIEGPPAGKFKTYRLNPYIAHKGAERDNTIADFDTALKDCD